MNFNKVLAEFNDFSIITPVNFGILILSHFLPIVWVHFFITVLVFY